MTSLVAGLAATAALATAAFAALWAASLRQRNASIVDVYWGPGFAAIAALGALDALGVALFATGLGFEAVGDWQLARFRAQPQNRGRVLDRGLWRYTRHPNYFGDSLAWWGMFCVAASTPLGPWTAVSPALMTFLLLRVSGVPLLERSLARTRPGYADYVARTSAFVPLPPRRSPTPGERGASFDRD